MSKSSYATPQHRQRPKLARAGECELKLSVRRDLESKSLEGHSTYGDDKLIGVKQLIRDHIHSTEQLFSELDTNGDGILSKFEVEDGFSAMGIGLSEAEIARIHIELRASSHLRDGRITPEVLTRWLRRTDFLKVKSEQARNFSIHLATPNRPRHLHAEVAPVPFPLILPQRQTTQNRLHLSASLAPIKRLSHEQIQKRRAQMFAAFPVRQHASSPSLADDIRKVTRSCWTTTSQLAHLTVSDCFAKSNTDRAALHQRRSGTRTSAVSSGYQKAVDLRHSYWQRLTRNGEA